jgi:hypothetical protein
MGVSSLVWGAAQQLGAPWCLMMGVSSLVWGAAQQLGAPCSLRMSVSSLVWGAHQHSLMMGVSSLVWGATHQLKAPWCLMMGVSSLVWGAAQQVGAPWCLMMGVSSLIWGAAKQLSTPVNLLMGPSDHHRPDHSAWITSQLIFPPQTNTARSNSCPTQGITYHLTIQHAVCHACLWVFCCMHDVRPVDLPFRSPFASITHSDCSPLVGHWQEFLVEKSTLFQHTYLSKIQVHLVGAASNPLIHTFLVAVSSGIYPSNKGILLLVLYFQ